METYANALLYAIPFFVCLVIFEVLYGYFVKAQKYSALDTVSSLSSGLTNIIKDSLGLVLVLVSYPYLLEHLALTEIKASWLVYVIAFICLDFASYWNHRLSHKVNIFWNQHVIHHSSEEFNLACALRQSISNIFGYFPLLLLPAAFLGIPNEVIALLAPLHLFAQFWYHTQHIGKLGILEYVIVTPSQHRVHHAINKEYIDKNLGAIFCVWDRMFGTFQEELDSVKPVYGILKPAETWNPIRINFQHLWRLAQDAWRTNSLLDKFRIWFMPTGWRPEDVKLKYPRTSIEDPYNFAKYNTSPSKLLICWSYFQLIITLLLLLFLFYNFKNIGTDGALLYGAVLFCSIYSYTALMDGDKLAPAFETLKFIFGLALIYTAKDWFGLNNYLAGGSWFISAYLLLSFVGTILFSATEYRYADDAKLAD